MSKQFVKLEGLDKLSVGLQDRAHMTEVRQIVKKHGALLEDKTKSNMDSAYTKGYSTGHTKGSVTLQLTDSGLTAIVAPHTAYFSYVEYGTRFMEAEPTLGPALTYQALRFVDELNRLFK